MLSMLPSWSLRSACVASVVVVGIFTWSCKDHGSQAEPGLIQYVDPLVGTAASTTESARKHSEAGSELKGQTFPAVGVPHGMTHWTPQTRATENKCIAPYYYRDSLFQGFRGSHWLSGSCTQDYGSVTIMPVSGSISVNNGCTARYVSHIEKSS